MHFFTFIHTNHIYGDVTRSYIYKPGGKKYLKKFFQTRLNGYVGMAIASVVASIVLETGTAIKECTMAKLADSHNVLNMKKGVLDEEVSKKQQHIEMCDKLWRNFKNKKVARNILMQMGTLLLAAPMGSVLEAMIFSPVETAKKIGRGGKAAATGIAKPFVAAGNKAGKYIPQTMGDSIKRAQHSVRNHLSIQKHKMQVRHAKTFVSAANKAKKAKDIGSMFIAVPVQFFGAAKNMMMSGLAALPTPPTKLIQFTFFLAAQYMIEPAFHFVYENINEGYVKKSEQDLLKQMSWAEGKNFQELSKPANSRQCARNGRGCGVDLLEAVKEFAHNNNDYREIRLQKAYMAQQNWQDYVIDLIHDYEDSKLFYNDFIIEMDYTKPKQGLIDPFKAVVPVQFKAGQLQPMFHDEELYSSIYMDNSSVFQDDQERLKEQIYQNIQTEKQQIQQRVSTIEQVAEDINYQSAWNLLKVFDQDELKSIMSMSEEELAEFANENRGKTQEELQVVFSEKSDQLIQAAEETANKVAQEGRDSIEFLDRAEEDPLTYHEGQRSYSDLSKELEILGESQSTVAAMNKYDRGRVLNIKMAAKFIKQAIDNWKNKFWSGGRSAENYRLEYNFLRNLYVSFNGNSVQSWKNSIVDLDKRVNSNSNACRRVEISSEGLEESGLSQREFFAEKLLQGNGSEVYCIKDFVFESLGFPEVNTYKERYVSDMSARLVETQKFRENYEKNATYGFEVNSQAETYLVNMICGPDEGTDDYGSVIGKVLPLTSLKFYSPNIIDDSVRAQMKKYCYEGKLNPARYLVDRKIYENSFEVVNKFGQKKKYTSLLELARENLSEKVLTCDGNVGQSDIPVLSAISNSQGHPSCNYNTAIFEYDQNNYVTNATFENWWEAHIEPEFETLMVEAKDKYSEIVEEVITPAYYKDYRPTAMNLGEAPERFDASKSVAGSYESEWNVYIDHVIRPIYMSALSKQGLSAASEENAVQKFNEWHDSVRSLLHSTIFITEYKTLEQLQKEVLGLTTKITGLQKAMGLNDIQTEQDIEILQLKVAQIQNNPNHPEAMYLDQYLNKLKILTTEDELSLQKVEVSENLKEILNAAVNAMNASVYSLEGNRALFTSIRQ
jgi:hypothetical protein